MNIWINNIGVQHYSLKFIFNEIIIKRSVVFYITVQNEKLTSRVQHNNDRANICEWSVNYNHDRLSGTNWKERNDSTGIPLDYFRHSNNRKGINDLKFSLFDNCETLMKSPHFFEISEILNLKNF